MTAGFENAIKHLKPKAQVVTAPYEYGSIIDVLWSMFNVSHGFSYEESRRLLFEYGITPKSRVNLIGFSGGVQRSVRTSQILKRAGIQTGFLFGINGPAVGPSAAKDSQIFLSPFRHDFAGAAPANIARWLLFFVPNNHQFKTVQKGGGHFLPYFPNGVTRAPRLNFHGVLRKQLSEESGSISQ